MLACTTIPDALVTILASVCGAIAASLIAIKTYYIKRTYLLKERAYTNYLTAFQELLFYYHIEEKRPKYQRAYFMARAKVYMCATNEVLQAIHAFHVDMVDPQSKHPVTIFINVIEAMRKDIKLDDTYDHPFDLTTV